MSLHRILIAFAFMLAIPALALAAPVPLQTPALAAAPAVQAAGAPALDAFLASLDHAGAVPLSGCGPNFCTQAERDACNQQCQGHHPFVGLECCSNTCRTLCICGSRPVGC
jgi:hypothetical protein